MHMEYVLAKKLQGSELPKRPRSNQSRSNQAGLAIVTRNDVYKYETFFNKPCTQGDQTSFKTKFFLDYVHIDDGAINPSWQTKGVRKNNPHIQIYRWHPLYKDKKLREGCVAVIRPVEDDEYDFYFYIFKNNISFSDLQDGAQFIKYEFGSSKKAIVIEKPPKVTQIRSSRKKSGKSISSENKAIEKHAEDVTEKYLKSKKFRNFKLLGKPYDILCNDDKTELRVEVKGTKGMGHKVGLTRNEILHSRDEYPPKHNQNTQVFLSIVNNIKTSLSNKKWIASNGKVVHIDRMYFNEDINMMFKNSKIKPMTFNFEIKKHKITL